ncbi:ABC transporter permease [Methanospirillum stamsii]|uniref:ABC transporter permease n=1 Tax=Methanospirillum stamsii TaxID=1277351 RepID=A0A2V2N512_9EURY|nr:ABC transporter permease [Methanospirillum stamsii]PWR75174.1 ABC transporter permease [Methanospirillum stamsii]
MKTHMHLRACLNGVFRVWLRNALVFRKNIRVNLIPPFIEPLLYLGAIGFGIGTYITDIDGLPYVRFIAPAILAASVMNASFFECAYGTYVRMYYQKTFDAILATPVTLKEVILGEIVWGATRGLISALSISIILFLFGLASPGGLLIAIPLSFIAGILFASIAACFSALSPSIDTISYPATLFIAPMFLFSGTFFPLHLLPQVVQYLALAFLPLTHVVSLTRALLTGTTDTMWALNMTWIAIGITVFSYLAIRLFERRLIV